MTTSLETDLDRFEARNSPQGLFARYARGRIASYWWRQSFPLAGAAALAFLIDPIYPLIALILAASADYLDCRILAEAIRRRPKGDLSRRMHAVVRASTALQTLALSAGLALFTVELEGTSGHILIVAMVAGAVLNAGLSISYVPGLTWIRLSLMGATLFFLFGLSYLARPETLPQLLVEGSATVLAGHLIWLAISDLSRKFERGVEAQRRIVRQNSEISRAHAHLADRMKELKRLSLVVETANDSVFITDPEGRIEYVNTTFTKLTGLGAQDVKGVTAQHLFDRLERSHDKRDEIASALCAGRSFRTECAILNLQRERIWLDMMIVPLLEPDGRMTGHVNVSRDITEAKAREAELDRAKMVAEEGERAKGRFLATISHELRTPLHGAMGALDLLRDTSLDETQKTYVDTVAESSEGLLQLVDMLLEVTRLEEKAVELDVAPFDLDRTIRRVMDLLQPLARAKGFSISLHVEAAPPAHVEGDATRLRQILVNIVGNAVKFTTRGSVAIGVSWTDGECVISVKDTGTGISADRLDAIFAPFIQEDGEITRRFGGTGLGLTISRLAAERMGGALTVTSRRGKGSIFTLRVPLPAATSAPPAPCRERGAPDMDLSGRVILVVDDNRTNRFLVERFLAPSGAQVVTAQDGVEAIAAWETHRPDAILMDVSMPRMDGLEVTRRIRARESGHCIILGLTASAFKQDRENGLNAGMDEFLVKPIQRPELLKAIADILPPAAGAEAGRSSPEIPERLIS